MLGIATFTIVESTMISDTATLITTRPAQRRRSGLGAGGVDGADGVLMRCLLRSSAC